MKNYERYEILKYIYINGDLSSTGTYNGALIKGMSSSKIPESNTKFFSEFKDYIIYENSRNNGLGWYLTEKGMNYIESNKGILNWLELILSDYPHLIKFISGGVIGSLITFFLKTN